MVPTSRTIKNAQDYPPAPRKPRKFACVRAEDGECSVWCGVTQGLRKGCVLSPLLVYVHFAVAIHAVPVRFSEDPDNVRDSMRLTFRKTG